VDYTFNSVVLDVVDDIFSLDFAALLIDGLDQLNSLKVLLEYLFCVLLSSDMVHEHAYAVYLRRVGFNCLNDMLHSLDYLFGVRIEKID
jgi:hypothetical protein